MSDTKDKSLIPPGSYCYSRDENGRRVPCPYWGINKDKPRQNNGTCSFIPQNDWDVDEFSRNSLLWDQVKECGINDDSEEE